MNDATQVWYDRELGVERRQTMVFFLDGPLEGSLLPVDDRHLIGDIDMPYAAMPPLERLRPDECALLPQTVVYKFEKRVVKITRWHRKEAWCASCGSSWGFCFDTDERWYRYLMNDTPLLIEQPKGSCDFEAWWAMRMIEIDQPELSYLAPIWESELRARQPMYFRRVSYEERARANCAARKLLEEIDRPATDARVRLWASLLLPLPAAE